MNWTLQSQHTKPPKSICFHPTSLTVPLHLLSYSISALPAVLHIALLWKSSSVDQLLEFVPFGFWFLPIPTSASPYPHRREFVLVLSLALPVVLADCNQPDSPSCLLANEPDTSYVKMLCSLCTGHTHFWHVRTPLWLHNSKEGFLLLFWRKNNLLLQMLCFTSWLLGLGVSSNGAHDLPWLSAQGTLLAVHMGALWC